MLKEMLNKVTDKTNFTTLQAYIDFASYFLKYIEENKHAIIVARNENHYNFYQYGEELDYRITRPFNNELLYSIEDFEKAKNIFLRDLNLLKTHGDAAIIIDRSVINRTVYTIQQSIGFGLDALPAGMENMARKINGQLFENLILLLFNEIGILGIGHTAIVPVKDEYNIELFKMNYQHDLIVHHLGEEHPRLIGSIKTTSKDRFAKVFIDKFLYNSLTETDVPHIAIFLHDVQRANGRIKGEYKVSQTFLPGHFKGYTTKLNPLDGVYYIDPRPVFQNDELIKQHIHTFDQLLCTDVWKLVN